MRMFFENDYIIYSNTFYNLYRKILCYIFEVINTFPARLQKMVTDK